MPNEFQYSVEDERKFGVLLDGAKDLIRGYHKSMSKGKINDELKKRDIDDRERIYWEERAPKLLDDLDHKFRDTVWVDWVKNKHTNWLTELLKDSELVDYVPLYIYPNIPLIPRGILPEDICFIIFCI